MITQKNNGFGFSFTLAFVLAAALCVFTVAPLRTHAATVNQTITTRIPGSGLVGWWTFDGKDMVNGVAQDKSGNGNNGNPANIATSTFYAQGKIGQGVNLDGVDDGINAGSLSVVDDLPALSVSVWAKPTGYGGGGLAYYVNKSNGGAVNGWVFQNNFTTSSVRFFAAFDGGTNLIVTSAANTLPSTEFNKWVHFVVTWDGSSSASNVHIYKNGVEVTYSVQTSGVGNRTTDATQSLFVGNNQPLGTSRSFSGTLDDVRIYNRVLSQTEITALYNASSRGIVANKTSSSERINPANGGLVGWWSFDGKDMLNGVAQDRSGQGNNGNLLNIASTTFYTGGKIGQAGNFDGVNDEVRISTVPTLTQPYTISLWFKSSLMAANRHLITFGSANVTPTILLRSSQDIEIDAASAGSFRTFCNKVFTSSELNRWSHLVIVINSSTDASQWKCYINNVDIAVANSDSSGTYANPPTTSWSIGSYPALSNRYFNGSIDDVRIYNRALSATEVANLYTSSSRGIVTNTSIPARLTSGLVGYWTFDGKDMLNGVARDVSGNGNTGNLLNIASTTFYTGGKIGQAGNFDGNNDVIKTTSDFIGTNDVTVTAWIKISSFTAGVNNTRIVNNGSFVFYPRLTGSTLAVSSDGLATNAVSANNAIALNQWVFVATTRASSGTANLYVNGVLSGTANQSSGTPVAGTGNVSIGNANTADRAVIGNLDDVRVYNRTLSAAEIASLYNLGR